LQGAWDLVMESGAGTSTMTVAIPRDTGASPGMPGAAL
jgi:hypothetical protein